MHDHVQPSHVQPNHVLSEHLFPGTAESPDADELLSLLAASPVPAAPVLVGVEGRGWGARLHHETLPEDPRCDAAGLFGFVAPPEWHTVGLLAPGTARRLDSPEADPQVDGVDDGERVVVVLAVDRAGDVRSMVRTEGGGSLVQPEAPQGLLVDGLLRSLGLPTNGPTPDRGEFALAQWLDAIVEAAALGRGVSVERLRALRPDDGTPWSELHRLAAADILTCTDLDPAEADWMDTPMFARWLRGGLGTVTELLDTLGLLLTHREREDLARALEADSRRGDR